MFVSHKPCYEEPNFDLSKKPIAAYKSWATQHQKTEAMSGFK